MLSKTCRNLDDVEYLAYAIVKQSEKLNESRLQLEFNLANQLGRPWYSKKLDYIAHFIATLKYNGVSIYYLKNRSNFETFESEEHSELFQSLCKSIAGFNEIQIKALFIKEMLFYRLISTHDIFSLAKKLMQKACDQQTIKAGDAPKSQFTQCMEYLVTLLELTSDLDCLLDDSFYEKIKGPIDATLATLKTASQGKKLEHVQRALRQLEMLQQHLQQSEKEFSEKRKNVQAELEKKEKEEKHNRWMEMLRTKDPKKYKAELEKDRKRAEEREQKRKEEEERAQRKAREAKEREPKTLDPIRGLVQEAIENMDSEEKMRETVGQIATTIGNAAKYRS